MHDEVVTSTPPAGIVPRSGTDVALLIAAILATQFISDGGAAEPLTWLHLPAIAATVYALVLLADVPPPDLPRRSHSAGFVRGLVHSYMLIILALSILVVGARLGFPIASHADAPNSQMHRVLRVLVALPCSILWMIALFPPALSGAVRLSPIFWLTWALNCVLLLSTAGGLRTLHF